MCIVNKFYIILISITLIKISYSFNNTSNVNQTEINGRKIIRKCCPKGQYPRRKICEDNNEVKVFSNLNIYDRNINDIHKSFDSLFTIVSGKFEENLTFKSCSTDIIMLNFIPYIIEDGSLQMEMPNTYDHWTHVNSEDYCVDYVIMKSGGLEAQPKFWTVLEDKIQDSSNNYLTSAFLISCAFMLLVLFVYISLPELQNLYGLILMAYVASLFTAFLLLAIIQMSQHDPGVCIVLTLGFYYFFLASLCWMTIMSYDIWWTFRGYAKNRPIHRRGERFKFFIYSLFAFGVSLLMTIGVGVLNTVSMRNWPWFITPHIPDHGCFFEGGVKLLYLYIPMLILNICNWMFFLMTAFNLWRFNRATAILDTVAAGTSASHRTQRRRFMIYLKLATVMGLNWLLEVFSFLHPNWKIWHLTDLCNVLIGFFIFLIFVCKKKIYRKLYKRYFTERSRRRLYPGSSRSHPGASGTAQSDQETITLPICSDPKGINSHTDN